MKLIDTPTLGIAGNHTDVAHPSGWQRSILVSVVLWAATRLTFLLIGAYVYRLHAQPVPWAGMWKQWDANFYLSVAAHGYQPPTVITGLENGQSNINFFPLLPLLIAAVHLVVPSIGLAGLLAANACLLGAAIFLHRLAARRGTRESADWTLLCLMVMPGSFALSGPLSEAPFLAVSILTALLAPKRPAAASFSSAVLTIARWTGILQGLGLALDWLIDRIRGRDATYRRLLPICLVPIPLFVFLAYMFWLTGDGLAPLHSNAAFWQQRFGVPFQSLFVFLHTSQPRLEIQSAVALALLALTASQARWFSAGEMFFVVASVACFASSESASPSLIRYTIGLYPVHLALGRLCARHGWMRLVLLCLAMIGAAIAVAWFQGSDLYV